ncbi:DUF551 domain-containing protein [Citrobacter sp. S5]|uniref:DUF551 domain-containing protein n=1 Tax=Citrobacter sp. S5 TaxID=3351561 RepID=UPI003D282264
MEWIKCSDQLPESKDDSVLVCSVTGSGDNTYGFPKGGFDMVHIQDYFDDVTDGFDENGKQKYTKMYIHAGITHWMPYPELPTE